jgi:beta-ribofuranosylaminobenzene 5'-phosphate synthase
MMVTIDTGSRLHLGFTNFSDDIGRCFGSLGVALDRPTTVVTVGESDDPAIGGHEPERTHQLVQRFDEHFGVRTRCSVVVHESIPQHVGLGSGTQLALAVGTGLARVHGIDADVWEIARAMDRCKRSAIGAAAFLNGGFLIDAGRRSATEGPSWPPIVVWRQDFPEDWCFVVAVPEAAQGLSGHGEEGVFVSIEPSVRISEEVCRLTQGQLMPALIERDIERFGEALTAIDEKNGEYFAALQGGVHGDDRVGRTVRATLEAGALGVGQSSWGPAIYGLVRERDASSVAETLSRRLLQDGRRSSVSVSRARNRRARIDVVDCDYESGARSRVSAASSRSYTDPGATLRTTR